MATSNDYSSCTICEHLHLSNIATVWCPECEESLCAGCNERHSVSKSTRNHDTLPVEDYRKLPPFILNIKHSCEQHNEKFQMYCLNHEKSLCKKCIVTTHKNCKDTSTLDDVTGNIKSSWAMEAVEKRAEEIIRTIQQIEKDRTKNLRNIYQTKDNIIKHISDIREQINHHLDKIQQQLVDELLSTAEKSEKSIGRFLEVLKAKQIKLCEIRGNIGKIKAYASNFQSFLGLKEMEKMVTKGEKYLQSAFDDGLLNQVEIEFSIEGKMKKFALICTTFGKLSTTTTAPSITLPQQTFNVAQIPKFPNQSSVSDIKLKSEREIKIGNTNFQLSVGCCVMPNGNIIFACDRSKIMAIHGSDGSYKCNIPTDHRVFDVTQIDQETVAATTGNDGRILFFDLKTKQKVRDLNVAESCWGISCSNGSIIVCVRDVGFQKIDIKTLKVSTIFKEDDLGVWSFVTTFEDKTYFTNSNTKTLKVLDANMTEIWRYHGESFLPEPRGVAVDQQGRVFVADKKEKRLVVMSPDGKHRQRFKYQIESPVACGLFYEKSRCRIIVVGYNGKALFVDCS